MFADRLSQLRQERNLTQSQLAGLVSISRSALSLYELGKREPDFKTLEKLADFFGVSIDYLLDRNPQENNSPVPPWMGKLTPQTRTRLEAVGGLRNFHTRFLGGTSLNDLDQHDLEIIMQVYFRHLEASEKKRKAKENQ